MERLLNQLIKKGWKPFGSNYERYEHGCLIHEFTTKDGVYSYGQYPTTIREFCAKESGLWQFVCENGMVNVPHPNKGKYPRDKLEREQYKYWDRTIGYYGEDNLDRIGYNWDKYQFRLIESSLKDESELEDFLLSNIKVEG